MDRSKSHPDCWKDGKRHHTCQKPSGRQCIERGCTNPAGTLWGPHWCPDCDVKRLDRISEGLESLYREGVW